MKLARYLGSGQVAIVDEAPPLCPPGGLLVRSEACGLCSGELMDWYMDRKIPHVLGHEVVGTVLESGDARFPTGARVFVHHHAPCLTCDLCVQGKYVHCEQWKRTKIIPGGMAEIFAIPGENLTDTFRVDDMRPIDAALIEPLACVVKSVGSATSGRAAVIGLGVMGLMHLSLLERAVGYDLNERRIEWAQGLGFDARRPEDSEPADVVFVCPGSQSAFDFAMGLASPGATIVLFAPLPPGEPLKMPNSAYFKDLRVVNSYSCGPSDTLEAADRIRKMAPWAERVVSDFIALDELPNAYLAMKQGRILKAMVRF